MIVLRRPLLRSIRSWNQRLSADVWLMSQPQPGKLDQRRPQPRIAGLRHTLLAIDRAALPGRRRQPGIGRHLPAVGEASAQALRPEHAGKFGPDTL